MNERKVTELLNEVLRIARGMEPTARTEHGRVINPPGEGWVIELLGGEEPLLPPLLSITYDPTWIGE